MIVLIADDHPSSTFVTAHLVEAAFGGVHQPETVADAASLLQQLTSRASEVALVVLDLTMPGDFKRLTLIREVRRLAPAVPVVVYSADDGPLFVEAAIELGIRGYVSKAAKFAWLQEAMRLALTGEIYIDPSINLSKAANHPWKTLTQAEREVVLALAKGQNLKTLAAESGRAYQTIANHKYAAMQKLDLNSNSEISGWLVASGLTFLLDP